MTFYLYEKLRLKLYNSHVLGTDSYLKKIFFC